MMSQYASTKNYISTE